MGAICQVQQDRVRTGRVEEALEAGHALVTKGSANHDLAEALPNAWAQEAQIGQHASPDSPDAMAAR
jgi:hypothetical protein